MRNERIPEVRMDREMPARAALLQEILDITREMREHALDSAWESVHEKEATRQTLIGRCFPLDQSIVNPNLAADSIKEIIELDRSVMSLAQLAREEMEDSFSRLKLGRQATNAYTTVEVGG